MGQGEDGNGVGQVQDQLHCSSQSPSLLLKTDLLTWVHLDLHWQTSWQKV